MKIKCTLSISISVILIFTPSLLIADTIELKNGQSWSGQIVSQSRTVIQIKTAQGTKILSKTDIRRVKFGVTSQEKAEQARRKQEMLDRQRQLELARQKNQTAKAAADQQKLDDLKKQEAKEAEDLIKREKAVLSAEEEMTRLNSDEADLEKKLEAIRNRKPAC